ncbi:HalD/BesD family halogenase [Anderseniella sp. Alg231-50]|uniref:HalD/BesD family halogenase n=1 Tax=Anderseniella sp. Alg231-50 TaxID=1922226 RepID=UPI000D54D461
MAIDVLDLVDLDKYPIHLPTSGDFRSLLAQTQAQLNDDGCAVLRGFVRADRITGLVQEANRVADRGHRSFNRTNVYFTQDNPAYRESHPLRRFFDRSNSFVPADNFGPESSIRSIYEWPLFSAFVQQALCEDRFFRYADPLADVIVNVAEEGAGFPWHFDTNNFTVTLAIQNAEQGGEFEYCPNLRTPDDENYPGVEAVLDENSSTVKTLALQPGDLQIFKGRYSLHRVRPLAGPRRRYVAIYSFVEEPAMVGSPERTRQLYGRVLPVHMERAGVRADTLVD